MINQKDQVSGAFFFLGSLLVIQQSLKLGLGDSTGPGPGSVPMIWGVALGVFSLATIIKDFDSKAQQTFTSQDQLSQALDRLTRGN